jgi:hypothetical protein
MEHGWWQWAGFPQNLATPFRFSAKAPRANRIANQTVPARSRYATGDRDPNRRRAPHREHTNIAPIFGIAIWAL